MSLRITVYLLWNTRSEQQADGVNARHHQSHTLNEDPPLAPRVPRREAVDGSLCSVHLLTLAVFRAGRDRGFGKLHISSKPARGCRRPNISPVGTCLEVEKISGTFLKRIRTNVLDGSVGPQDPQDPRS